MWRRQNLATNRIWSYEVELIKAGTYEDFDGDPEKARTLANWDKFELRTTEGMLKELAVEERLDMMIDRCLKKLLFVRGLKSMGLGPAT